MKELYPEVNINKVGIVGVGRIGGALAEAIDCEVDEIGRDPDRETFNHDFLILAVGPEKYPSFDDYCQSLAWIKEKVPMETPIGIVAYTPGDNLVELKRKALGEDRPVVRFLCTIAIRGKYRSKLYNIEEDDEIARAHLRAALPKSWWAKIPEEDYAYEANKLASVGLICAVAKEVESGFGPAPNPGNEAMTVLGEACKMIRRTMSPEEAVEKTATPGGLTRQVLSKLDLDGVAEVVAEASRSSEEQ